MLNIFSQCISQKTKPTTIYIGLLHIVDEDNTGDFVYIQEFEK